MNCFIKGYKFIYNSLSPLFGAEIEKKEDPIHILPLDIMRRIFSQTKEDLVTIAKVSRGWKAIVYDKAFRDWIGLPTDHFLGNESWKKLPGVDVDKEPHLPLCVYRDVKPNDFLGLVHKTVKIDQKEIKIGPKLLGELAARQLKGLHSTGFHENSWKMAINEHQGAKTMHWVWIRPVPIGLNENFSEQEKRARTFGGQPSEFFDTLVCLFLDRIRSGDLHFNWDSDNWIRVPDKVGIDNKQIWIGSSSTILIVHEDTKGASNDICVLVARKSIGI